MGQPQVVARQRVPDVVGAEEISGRLSIRADRDRRWGVPALRQL